MTEQTSIADLQVPRLRGDPRAGGRARAARRNTAPTPATTR